MQVFNRHVSGKGLTVFSFETILISGTMLVAARAHGSLDSALGGLWKIGVATAVFELSFYYDDLYDLTVVHSRTELLMRVRRAAGTGAIALALLSVVVPAVSVGHGIFVTSLWLLLVAIPLWRLAFNGLTRDRRLEQRVLILGTGPIARLVTRQIKAQHDFAYHIVGCVTESSDADVAELGLPL